MLRSGPQAVCITAHSKGECNYLLAAHHLALNMGRRMRKCSRALVGRRGCGIGLLWGVSESQAMSVAEQLSPPRAVLRVNSMLRYMYKIVCPVLLTESII